MPAAAQVSRTVSVRCAGTCSGDPARDSVSVRAPLAVLRACSVCACSACHVSTRCLLHLRDASLLVFALRCSDIMFAASTRCWSVTIDEINVMAGLVSAVCAYVAHVQLLALLGGRMHVSDRLAGSRDHL